MCHPPFKMTRPDIVAAKVYDVSAGLPYLLLEYACSECGVLVAVADLDDPHPWMDECECTLPRSADRACI